MFFIGRSLAVAMLRPRFREPELLRKYSWINTKNNLVTWLAKIVAGF
jgi:hypothetical protein